MIGKDQQGNEIYHGISEAHRHVYCSPAYEPWRRYLIEQMREAVEVGVDLIYIDESMSPCGKFIVDGVTGIEGMMLLQKEIMETFPDIALETEQFNLMTNRHAAFALSQMGCGHPISGYIFHRFVKVVPEGILYEPTTEKQLDSFQSWGFMLPGASRRNAGDQPGEKSWLQIAKAFQTYDLVPDSRLPHKVFRNYEPDGQYGVMPVWDTPLPQQGCKLFGYRGLNGVTAYFEKYPDKRGLVVYESGKKPRWFGTRHNGIQTWSGPGALEDWMIYKGDTLLGLDPKKTYMFDETITLPQDSFHVTKIPEDFAEYQRKDGRIIPQDIGNNGSYYKLTFTGNGKLEMYVPDDVLVFLDGQKVPVVNETNKASVTVSAALDQPSILLAFKRSDVMLEGKWANLPWQEPPRQRSWYVGQHTFYDYSAEGPVRKKKEVNHFFNHVAGLGMIIGKFPQTGKIHIQGAYKMREQAIAYGDGVIRINGKEILRIKVPPPSEQPYKLHAFDVDISQFTGTYAFIEFLSDGLVYGPGAADWLSPQIIVER